MDYDIGPDEPVSAAVVRAVCAVEDRDPRSIRPLTEVVDPDALDRLFDSQSDGTPRVGGRVSFVYGDSEVTVENGEHITLRQLSRGTDSDDADSVGAHSG